MAVVGREAGGWQERWMVSNQLRILEALYPEEAESLAVQREANERDYEYVYDINSPIDTDTMDESYCQKWCSGCLKAGGISG